MLRLIARPGNRVDRGAGGIGGLAMAERGDRRRLRVPCAVRPAHAAGGEGNIEQSGCLGQGECGGRGVVELRGGGRGARPAEGHLEHVDVLPRRRDAPTPTAPSCR